MLISVIIPCYNVEAYIGDCLASVVAQDYSAFEIICVDDGSTDSTAAIVAGWQEKYPDRISFYRNEKNGGAPAARNRGLKLAKGAYIQFLDADDLLLSGKINHQVELLRQQPALPAFIAADYIRRKKDGSDFISRSMNGDVWLSLLFTRLGITSSNLWNREAVMNAGGFDESMKSSQEYDLMFRLLENGGTALTDSEPLTVVRERERNDSISQVNRDENWLRYASLRIRMLNFIRKKRELPAIYFQPLFNALLAIYAFDPEKAKQLHRENIPQEFRPEGGFLFRALYAVFGFGFTARLSRSVNKGGAK